MGDTQICIFAQMKEEHKTGAEGEAAAVKYLRSQGYEVLETNWRFGQEEIDIIAQTKDFLVIVEVKTRSSKAFGEPDAIFKPVREFIASIKEDLESREMLRLFVEDECSTLTWLADCCKALGAPAQTASMSASATA